MYVALKLSIFFYYYFSWGSIKSSKEIDYVFHFFFIYISFCLFNHKLALVRDKNCKNWFISFFFEHFFSAELQTVFM